MASSRKPKSMDLFPVGSCAGQTEQSVSNTNTGSAFSKLVVVCAFSTAVAVLTLVYMSLSSLQEPTANDLGLLGHKIELLRMKQIKSRFEFTDPTKMTNEPANTVPINSVEESGADSHNIRSANETFESPEDRASASSNVLENSSRTHITAIINDTVERNVLKWMFQIWLELKF
jgi:hypothetical protein